MAWLSRPSIQPPLTGEQLRLKTPEKQQDREARATRAGRAFEIGGLRIGEFWAGISVVYLASSDSSLPLVSHRNGPSQHVNLLFSGPASYKCPTSPPKHTSSLCLWGHQRKGVIVAITLANLSWAMRRPSVRAGVLATFLDPTRCSCFPTCP